MTDQLKRRLALAQAVEEGRFHDLECPDCGARGIRVAFTHPFPDEYRTWLICSSCGGEVRIQNPGRPRYFSEDRIDLELQRRDLDMMARPRFPRPNE